MGIETGIAWADHTKSPWEGCQRVHTGCEHCYAEARNRRFGGRYWGPESVRRVTPASSMKELYKWNRLALAAGEYRRTFPSICDPFEAFHGDMVDSKGKVLDECMPFVRQRFFKVVEETRGLFHILLTKRPQNVLGMVPTKWLESPPANVIICASASDQGTMEESLDTLLDWPGYKGLSLEPLVGPAFSFEDAGGIGEIDWVVVGGESGGKARRCYAHWIGLIVSMCEAREVACYVKQLGSNAWAYEEPGPSQCGCREWDCPHQASTGPLNRIVTKHPKGGDPAEWPASLRVQEYPAFMQALPPVAST